MIYRAIGLMSGSSLDGLDIAFAEFHENGGKWDFEIKAAECYPYSTEWVNRLKKATELNAFDYQLLHIEYGHYLGREVNRFIDAHDLHYQVGLVSSHGHTTFHDPSRGLTAQLGDGASIAAETGLPVVSDLRAMDVALGGQGAPIVPIGEQLLFNDYAYFLNVGGIANISFNQTPYIAFDVCAANRVLNMLAANEGLEYDNGGQLAASGEVNPDLLQQLNALAYYQQPAPKSLANSFGIETVYPILKATGLPTADLLKTYCEHIALQIADAIANAPKAEESSNKKMLVTGGGALNTYLMDCLQKNLSSQNIEVVLPEVKIINYKEALVMALIGVLRWREEVNVLSSVTGAKKDSVGGAMWMP